MREVHRFIADTILLSDRFDAAVERISRAACWNAPAARLQWRAPGLPV